MEGRREGKIREWREAEGGKGREGTRMGKEQLKDNKTNAMKKQ